MWNIIIQIVFFALVIKVQRGVTWASYKNSFPSTFVLFLFIFPIPIIVQKYVYLFKMLITLYIYYDGEGDRKIYFTREKSYFPRTTPEGNMIFLGV